MGLITELWIIESNGTLLYNQKTKTSVNPILFSGFMSAILQFVQQLGESSVIHVLKLGNSNFVILKEDENKIIIVGKAEGKVDTKKVQKLLEKIALKFINKYQDILRNWDGNIEYFESFSDILDLDTDEDNILDKFKKLSW
ncbi:MAG: hypothetical protein GY870_22155 [archaeon]|nr:hypothetical protein [archaeon]